VPLKFLFALDDLGQPGVGDPVDQRFRLLGCGLYHNHRRLGGGLCAGRRGNRNPLNRRELRNLSRQNRAEDQKKQKHSMDYRQYSVSAINRAYFESKIRPISLAT
jgi:hypothetical protein